MRVRNMIIEQNPKQKAKPWLTRIGILRVVFGASSIALALAWGKFIDVGYVYFPFFPNVLDVSLGVIIGLFLLWEAIKK